MKKTPEDIVKKITDMFKDGVEHHRPYVANIELTLAFLSGNQWMKANRYTGLEPITNSTNEIRCTKNVMFPTHRWRMARLFKENPVITCFEGGDELVDVERAFIASKLCEYWRTNTGWLEAEKEAAKWADVTGLTFIAPVWRTNPFTKIKRKTYDFSDKPIESEDGKISYIKESEVEENDADIAFDVYSIFNTYLFPQTANTWGKVTASITAEVASFDWICENINQDLEENTLKTVNPSEVNYDALDRVNSYVSGEFVISKTPNPNEKRYLILTYRERPTFQYPDGRYIVIVGGKKITDTILPYIEEIREIDPNNCLNISKGLIPWFAPNIAGRLIPPSPMELLREAQVELNELLTDQKQNRKTIGRNKIILEKDSIDKNAFTNEHGEILEIERSSNGLQPVIMQGRTLDGIEREIEQKQNEFDDISGRSQIFKGQNLPQVRSAFHMDMLREEASTLIDEEGKAREKVHELVAKVCLAIARRRMTREKIIKIVGEDAAGMAISFLQSGNINLDIRVKEGSTNSRNHALIESKLLELLQYGAFNDPATGKVNIDLFWSMTKLGTLNRNVDKQEKIRTRAKNENYIMYYRVEPQMPQDHEDHTLHMEEHKDWMNRPEWYKAKPEVKALFMAHMNMHKEMQTNEDAPALYADAQPERGMIENAVFPSSKPQNLITS